MLAAERRREILRRAQGGPVTVAVLSAELGVSEMTVRRDLDTLDTEGSLRKVRGGAVRRHSRGEELLATTKAGRHHAQKRAIAAAAAELVQDGATIAIGAGTTTVELAAQLVGRAGLTVITNSVAVFAELSDPSAAGPTVYLTGGVRTPSDALVGPIADATLAQFRVDLAFLGAHAVDIGGALLTPNLAEARTNREMIGIADQLVVLADSSKLAETGSCVFAGLDQIAVLVTDAGIDATTRATLAERVGALLITDVETT